jgi:hypothetical protein
MPYRKPPARHLGTIPAESLSGAAVAEGFAKIEARHKTVERVRGCEATFNRIFPEWRDTIVDQDDLLWGAKLVKDERVKPGFLVLEGSDGYWVDVGA